MRYILSIVLGAIGLYLIILNWGSFYITYVKKERFCSWIPLIPGIIAALAFVLFPNNSFIYLFWICFLLDWGCIPGFVFTVYMRHKK